YSHLLLIPLVSAWLLFLDRRRIFWQVGTHWGAGVGLLFAGALLHWFGHRHAGGLSENDRLAVAIVPILVIWTGGFVLCYGARAFRAALFPMLFLLLMVPIP